MKLILRYFAGFFILVGCGSSSTLENENQENYDFILAFGSCNKQEASQPLWYPILENEPDVFVWGGDNIYADTEDMERMAKYYEIQKNQPGYRKLVATIPVLGTWDDHDYGINDGGANWEHKEESQQLFLNFFDVPENDPRRERAGVYHSEIFNTPKGQVKVIILDTRFFRDELKRNFNDEKRYKAASEGGILGDEQWKWLQTELENSSASFNIIVSSIQVLSAEHGFETWGNFPEETRRLTDLIITSEAENVIILSGDRHISEFSESRLNGLDYPLMDFTSSGLTHVYEQFSGEPNQYRIGKVINELSFGLVKIDLENQEVQMEMRGENNRLLQQYKVRYSN